MSSESPATTLTANDITIDRFWHSIENAWRHADDGGAHNRLASASSLRRGKAFVTVRRKLNNMLSLLGDYLYPFTSAQLYSWRDHFQRVLDAIWHLRVPNIHITKFDDAKLWLSHCSFAITAGRAYYEVFRSSPTQYMFKGANTLMASIVLLPARLQLWIAKREEEESKGKTLEVFKPNGVGARRNKTTPVGLMGEWSSPIPLLTCSVNITDQFNRNGQRNYQDHGYGQEVPQLPHQGGRAPPCQLGMRKAWTS